MKCARAFSWLSLFFVFPFLSGCALRPVPVEAHRDPQQLLDVNERFFKCDMATADANVQKALESLRLEISAEQKTDVSLSYKAQLPSKVIVGVKIESVLHDAVLVKLVVGGKASHADYIAERLWHEILAQFEEVQLPD